jgi:hypothetical protein
VTRPFGDPKVSVVMSVYNGARYLRRAIESVLAQTYAEFEFIILNDGSTDDSSEIIQSYADPRIRYVEQANVGLPAALNKGIGLSRGTYVARMDADDVSLPSRFARQVQFLDEHPNYAMVGTSCRVIDSEENVKFVMRHPCEDVHIRWLLLFDSPFVHSTMMFRRDAIQAAGLYRAERGYYVEDYDLWSRVLARYKGQNLAEPLLLYRDNPVGISHRKRTTQEEQSAAVSARNIATLLNDGGFTRERAYLVRCLRTGRLKELSQDQLDQSLADLSRVHQAFLAVHATELKLLSSVRAQVNGEYAGVRMLASRLLAMQGRQAAAFRVWISTLWHCPRVLLGVRPLKTLVLLTAGPRVYGLLKAGAIGCVKLLERIRPRSLPKLVGAAKAKLSSCAPAYAWPRTRTPQTKVRYVATCYTDSVARFSKFRSRLYGKSGLDLFDEAGISLEVSRPYWHGIHLYWNGERVNHFSRGERILVRGEPPNVLPKLYDEDYLRQFHCIVSIVKAGADFHWGYPTHHDVDLNRPLAERGLLSFMNANKRARAFFQNDLYAERVTALHEILEASSGTVPDVYGLGWAGIPTSMGSAGDKLQTLSRYLFNLCFENYRAEGYVTEKIIDCFYAGTIPVYLGAPDISTYVPRDAFIDARKFSSYRDLLAFLRELSTQPTTLNNYIETGKRFLKSPAFEDHFTSFAFATQIVKAVTHATADA